MGLQIESWGLWLTQRSCVCFVPPGQDGSQLPRSGRCRITAELMERSAHLTWCRWYTGELKIFSSPPMWNRYLVNYASFKLGLQFGLIIYNHDLLTDKLAFDFEFWISHLHSWCVVIMELMLGTSCFLGQQCEHTGQLFSSYFIRFNLNHGIKQHYVNLVMLFIKSTLHIPFSFKSSQSVVAEFLGLCPQGLYYWSHNTITFVNKQKSPCCPS